MLRVPLLLAACVSAANGMQNFDATFAVTLAPGEKAEFTIRCHPAWAPLAAERFRTLIDDGFFSNVRFFRVVAGFMVQFGISGKPNIATEWREKKMTDDPVVKSNTRGMLSFATSGKDSRTTQMFINFGDNSRLDGMDFAPFGEVLGDGMKFVDRIHSCYGETPNQGQIQSMGNKYLKKEFPKLSYINSVTIHNQVEL
jgi:peptidyl-prolyl cis-trans isomerase A (cyclophilin A)